MKTESMNSLNDLFTYGFSSAQAHEHGTAGHTAPGLVADAKLRVADPVATEAIQRPSPASPEKSVTIL